MIGDQVTTGFDHEVEVPGEVPQPSHARADRREDLPGRRCQPGISGRRQTTAEIDESEPDPLFPQSRQDSGKRVKGRLPSAYGHLLRPHVQRKSRRPQSERPRPIEHPDRVVAAAFAGQSPHRARPGGRHPAEDPAARSVPRDRLDVLDAVRGVRGDAQPMRRRDVGIGLDGVAVVHPAQPDPGPQRLTDLARAGGVEAGAQVGQGGQHVVDRARLHREPDLDPGQLGAQPPVLVVDAGQVVDDPVGAGRGQGGAQMRSQGHLRRASRGPRRSAPPTRRSAARSRPCPGAPRSAGRPAGHGPGRRRR